MNEALDTDEMLFARVREGDMQAFDVLYERYEVRLFAYLRALCGNASDAEEVFHDAFMNALRDGSTRFDDGGFRAWLYRIARNLAMNRRRSASRREKAHAAAPETSLGESAEEAMAARELETALVHAVGRLPESLGELYHLRSSGLSYEQIAVVVEVPIGTVKSRMHHLVHALREELTPWIAPS